MCTVRAGQRRILTFLASLVAKEVLEVDACSHLRMCGQGLVTMATASCCDWGRMDSYHPSATQAIYSNGNIVRLPTTDYFAVGRHDRPRYPRIKPEVGTPVPAVTST